MFKSITSLILLSVFASCCHAAIFRDCGNANSTIQFLDFTAPDPFRITQDLIFSIKFNLVRPFERGTYTRLDVRRRVNLVFFETDIPIPCIRYSTEAFAKFGTCEYDFCDVNLMRRSYVCDFFVQSNLVQLPNNNTNANCQCPLPAGIYEGKDYLMHLPFENLRFLVSMFAQGYYKSRWTFHDRRDNEIGCVYIETNVLP